MPSAATTERTACRFLLRGVVQGVGLRPAVFRLAVRLGLGGSARNDSGGLLVEVEGDAENVRQFGELLPSSLPAAAKPDAIRSEAIPTAERNEFTIEGNDSAGPLAVAAPPDRAACGECVAEIDATLRRKAYAFTSCTTCGPRYSILIALPYERAATSMAGFALCAECQSEFTSPADRRFHAETNACPKCGPRISVVDAAGKRFDSVWLPAVVATLKTGRILALKGVGGYQLLCDAANAEAVRKLRERKGRALKPLAILVGSLERAEALVQLDDAGRRALTSPANPIVLAPAKAGSGLAAEINPGLDTVGVLLPTTPLHWLVAVRFGGPLVCTSGNREGDPLETDPAEAERRLKAVADLFLHHDRPIVRPVDDSVVRIIAGRAVTLRLARGLAPLPLALPSSVTAIAVGGQQKVALAWSNGVQAALGPHIGDVEALRTRERFAEAIADVERLYRFTPKRIIHDAHPDYVTTTWAGSRGVATTAVWHHHAHVAAAMLEHGWLDRAVLGVAWDGTGLGFDGTIWGGEFLVATTREANRVAHLRPFCLPGGEVAIREPWRSAAAVLRDAVGPERTVQLLARLGDGRVADVLTIADNERFSPRTTSAGRLFDAAACLLLGIDAEGFDGRPAMLLEAACDPSDSESYPLPLTDGMPAEIDWRPMFAGLAEDVQRGAAPGKLAMRFHRSLALAIAATCSHWPDMPVVLTGGVFQNRVLTELVAVELGSRALGLPGRIPPNDGGLAAGQLVIGVSQSG
jgi:hydrogenase maturation protein HypF